MKQEKEDLQRKKQAMNNDISVIIPCRNGESTIARAILSAVEAGANEILVYDDASTDGTFNILSNLCKEIDILEFYSLSDVRMGVNFARNFLTELANSEFILPLDCDDTLHNLQPVKDACEVGSWVYGNNLQIEDNQERLILGAPSGALVRKNITGVSFCFSKTDWLNVNGYDPDFAFAEDYGFQCCLTNSGVKPKYIDNVIYSRYMKPDGNERSVLAGLYWGFYRDMARAKYQVLFANVG